MTNFSECVAQHLLHTLAIYLYKIFSCCRRYITKLQAARTDVDISYPSMKPAAPATKKHRNKHKQQKRNTYHNITYIQKLQILYVYEKPPESKNAVLKVGRQKLL